MFLTSGVLLYSIVFFDLLVAFVEAQRNWRLAGGRCLKSASSATKICLYEEW